MSANKAIFPTKGERYTRLLMTGQWEIRKGRRVARAYCDCGIIFWFDYSKVRAGKIKSCGCLRIETYKVASKNLLKKCTTLNHLKQG